VAIIFDYVRTLIAATWAINGSMEMKRIRFQSRRNFRALAFEPLEDRSLLSIVLSSVPNWLEQGSELIPYVNTLNYDWALFRKKVRLPRPKRLAKRVGNIGVQRLPLEA
jgi:hypothetical protein